MNLFDIRKQLNMGFNLKDIELRVTYYSRVSTDHEDQKKSLNNQNDHFKKMIEENKKWEYIDGYIDDGITGTSDIKRNSFMKMINDSKKDIFDLIITKEISRFSRNTLDSIKYTRELLNNGVAVLFLNDNINTIYPDSELRLTIMASMAQDEIRRLSERVKFGMRRAQEKGEFLGNNKIYGYRKDKKLNRLIKVKEEAKVIEEIFIKYLFEDMSLTKIKDYLNEKNIKTIEKKNWSTTAISRIIKNPKYKGYYCGKKVEVIDYMTKKIKYNKKEEWIMYKTKNIDPIISEYIWDKSNAKINKKINKRERINKRKYPNKIYCAKDNSIYYHKYFRKNKKELTWVCSKYLQHGKKACDTANIRESELDIILSELIEIIDITPKLIYLLKQKYKDNDIVNSILKIINKEEIKEIIIDRIIEKILVNKQNNNINLDIYLRIENIDETKKYKFIRGLENKYTKKYEVIYNVNILQVKT